MSRDGLRAVAGATVRGPILAPLACGCVVDSDGGVWAPCEAIADEHTWAMDLVKQGPQLRLADHPKNEHGYPDPRIPNPLDKVLAYIAAHVAAGERAAHQAADQRALL